MSDPATFPPAPKGPDFRIQLDVSRWANDITQWLTRCLNIVNSTTTDVSATNDRIDAQNTRIQFLESLVSSLVAGQIALPAYAVAELPAPGAAQAKLAYASDGRKNGEGGGSGTGVMVFSDGTAWRACDTGQTVAA